MILCLLWNTNQDIVKKNFFYSIQWKSLGSKTTLDPNDFHCSDKNILQKLLRLCSDCQQKSRSRWGFEGLDSKKKQNKKTMKTILEVVWNAIPMRFWQIFTESECSAQIGFQIVFTSLLTYTQWYCQNWWGNAESIHTVFIFESTLNRIELTNSWIALIS